MAKGRAMMLHMDAVVCFCDAQSMFTMLHTREKEFVTILSDRYTNIDS